jgi:hypothetical protein
MTNPTAKLITAADDYTQILQVSAPRSTNHRDFAATIYRLTADACARSKSQDWAIYPAIDGDTVGRITIELCGEDESHLTEAHQARNLLLSLIPHRIR